MYTPRIQSKDCYINIRIDFIVMIYFSFSHRAYTTLISGVVSFDNCNLLKKDSWLIGI